MVRIPGYYAKRGLVRARSLEPGCWANLRDLGDLSVRLYLEGAENHKAGHMSRR